jgi:hypothetical protein
VGRARFMYRVQEGVQGEEGGAEEVVWGEDLRALSVRLVPMRLLHVWQDEGSGGVEGQCNVRGDVARAEMEDGIATQRNAGCAQLQIHDIITSDRSGGRIDPVQPVLPHRDSGDAVQKIGMPIVVRDVHYSVCGSGSVRALV